MVELIAKGCLGTCWYGKYHYVEPWAGCEHNCHYCYARFRGEVQKSLQHLKTEFAVPQPLLPVDQLTSALKKGVTEHAVKIAKLSRYTDIFSPSLVAAGASFEVLRALAESAVERIILTTKGVPDARSLDLMAANATKFSFNLVAKPESPVVFEPNALPLRDRLKAAANLQSQGVRTTIHMDPIIVGFEDSEAQLEVFFDLLQQFGLNRVMFSYLLLNAEMTEYIRARVGAEAIEALLANYQEGEKQMLPRQEDTAYRSLKPECKNASVNRIVAGLQRGGFEFVVCSLKNQVGGIERDAKECPRCDGSFYA